MPTDIVRRLTLATDLRETARRILDAEPHDLATGNTADELEQAAGWLQRVADRMPS